MYSTTWKAHCVFEKLYSKAYKAHCVFESRATAVETNDPPLYFCAAVVRTQICTPRCGKLIVFSSVCLPCTSLTAHPGKVTEPGKIPRADYPQESGKSLFWVLLGFRAILLRLVVLLQNVRRSAHRSTPLFISIVGPIMHSGLAGGQQRRFSP